MLQAVVRRCENLPTQNWQVPPGARAFRRQLLPSWQSLRCARRLHHRPPAFALRGTHWSTHWSTSLPPVRQAVDAIYPGAERRDAETLKDGSEYARFQIKGAFEVPDEVEFLVRPTGPGDRGWKGDTGGLLVTYRSCAGTVKYVYPFLTPIPDGGLQSKRLQRLREELGWRLVGCELVECFPRGQ